MILPQQGEFGDRFAPVRGVRLLALSGRIIRGGAKMAGTAPNIDPRMKKKNHSYLFQLRIDTGYSRKVINEGIVTMKQFETDDQVAIFQLTADPLPAHLHLDVIGTSSPLA